MSFFIEALASKHRAISTWAVLESDIETREQAEVVAAKWRELLPDREVRIGEDEVSQGPDRKGT